MITGAVVGTDGSDSRDAKVMATGGLTSKV